MTATEKAMVQASQIMETQRVNVVQMAKKLKTTRQNIKRMLEASHVTVSTLEKIGKALRHEVEIELRPKK